MQDSSTTLAERYGAPPAWRRPVIWVVSVAIVVASAAWVVWALRPHTDPGASSDLKAFEVIDQHTVDARVGVDIDAEATEVACLLRAYAEDHNVVGERSFSPEPGTAGLVTVRIRTAREASSIEMVGCTTADQKRPG